MRFDIPLLAILLLLLSTCAHHQPASPSAPLGGVLTTLPDTKTLTVTFVDVKQADAILIQLGDVDLLVDAGVQGGCANLREALKSVSGAIEILFITHPHDDHFGCASKDVLASYRVNRIITNGERRGPPRDDKPLARWTEFESAVEGKGLALEWLPVGTTLKPAPGLSLTVLASGSPDGGTFPDHEDGAAINNDSLVMMLGYAGRRILLTGDIEGEANRMLVKRYCKGDACEPLKADVLKVPHHGSAEFDAAFYRAVRPEFAVVTADYKSEKHHLLRAQPIRALQELSARIYSTSAKGSQDVALEVSASGVMTWTAPTAPVFAWEGKEGLEVSFAQ